MAYIGNQPADKYSTLSKQTITGDGTTGPYTLDYSAATAQDIEVFVNNVRQEPGVAYTVSGTALTMTGNVLSTDDFYVVFQGKAVQTTTHPAGQTLQALDAQLTGDLKLETSSGGIYTVTGTDTSTDRTLTLPDEAGTVLTDGSALPAIDGSALTSLEMSQISDGGLALVSSGSFSDTANITIDTTNFSSDYYQHIIILEMAKHSGTYSGGEVRLYLSTDNGSTYLSSGHAYSVYQNHSGWSANLTQTSSSRNGSYLLIGHDGLNDKNGLYKIEITGLNRATDAKSAIWHTAKMNHDANNFNGLHGIGGIETNTSSNHAIKVNHENSATLTGTYRIYGRM
jgi:hypothetical protein